MITLALLWISSALPTAMASDRLPTHLPTHLSAMELERVAQDEIKYPHFMKFIESIDSSKLDSTDPHNFTWIKTSGTYNPSVEVWGGFFTTAAEDHLTALRAFALLGRETKKRGIVVFGPGKIFEQAVNDYGVDLGLALPATNIGTAIWSPDPSNKDPEFQVHLKVFYTQQYKHRFPDEILPANLKIGYGPEETYCMDGVPYVQHTVDTDIFDGPAGVGFRNVRGISGQKRGFLGVLQAIAFFLPDAIHAMVIDEKKDRMVTVAVINTTIKHFETNPLYCIKIRKK